MNNISRRKFVNKVSGAGIVLPFMQPLDLFKGSTATSSVHVFSKHLQFLDIKNMATAAADIGFDGVDLTVRPGGHVLPERVTEDLPKAVSALKEKGLQSIMMATEITDAANPVSRNVLQSASSLRIKYFRTGYFRYPAQGSLPEMLKQYENQLNALAAFTAPLGIRGAYQNHAGNYVGASTWELYQIIKSADKTGLGCQFDIRHAVVEGGQSWPQSIRLLSPYINTINIKDFLWEKINGKWSVKNVPLGEGMVDFPKYFSLLKQYGVQVPVSLHFEYELGGAGEGARQISISQNSVFEAMHRDLVKLRGWLKDAGMS